MNSENSKTPRPHVLILELTNKLYLRIGKRVIAFSKLSIYCTWKNMKSSYNNNKFKTSAPTWIDKFELPDVFCIKYLRLFWGYLKKTMEKTLIIHQ